MICPCFFSIKYGIMALLTYINPFTLVSSIVSQSSRFAFSKLSRPKASPALFTKILMSLHSGGRLFSVSNTSFLFCTSKTSGNTLILYLLFNSSANENNFSFLLPVMMQFHPLEANFSAMAFPKPEVAPVIRMILFIKNKF